MIQKTFIAGDPETLRAELLRIKEDTDYQAAGERVLLFSDQEDDAGHLREQMALIHEILPELRVVGITMPYNGILDGEYGSGRLAGYSVLLCERAGVELYHYSCREMSAQEAGKRLRRELRYREHIAGVLVFAAGVERQIDLFLTTLSRDDCSDVPVIGAQASSGTKPYLSGSFNGGEPEDCGIVALVFHGRGLHMYYNYEMGWRPIGKEMHITETDGNYCVTSIDGQPAVSIYQKYLGVEPDQFFVENVREFPFITRRGERQVVRTPSGVDGRGRLQFIARVNEGDTLRLSYGNPRRMLEETKAYAETMRNFEPQALILIDCENRVRFLKEQAAADINAYRSFMPMCAWVRGFTAVILDRYGGGVVNAAILSIGFREGAPRGGETEHSSAIGAGTLTQGAIPLDQRLAMFLEQTTKELEDMAFSADAANAAKSDFLSQMSHEIRTPINAVIGMNEMILRESRDENVLQYAENARIAGLNLLSIISDILDFSKIEARKMEIVPADYELSSLIGDLVSMIRMRAEDKGLAFRLQVDPATPHLLRGDELRLKQIVTNLLTNAVKYTEHGSVELIIGYEKSPWAEEILLHVAVRDTGIGIREEHREKLFTAFERIDQERARRIEGTGLGLTITQQLLHLMGSTLEVESEYGKGSTFSFTLSQHVVSREGIGRIETALTRIAKRRSVRQTRFTAPEARILVVDDAPMNLAVISGLLKRTRMQVDTAAGGRECIEKFMERRYDLVFLDHRMPEMDGVETLQELKRRCGESLQATPVISLTANAVAGAREEYLAAGFSDYLAKPVMPDELEAMLLRYLPAERIHRETDAAEPEPEMAPALPGWLKEIGLLHTEQGVEYCCGVDEYVEALRLFAGSVSERAEELDELYRAQDWGGYTIKVHALKTMARSIGASELSDLAHGLEDAGSVRDTASLCAGHEVFLSLYRSLGDALRTLNALRESTEGNQGAESEIAGEGRRCILLIDDDADFLRLTGRWLSKEHTVVSADSGAAALEKLKSLRPDLILLDYAMPVMDGPATFAEIRKRPELAEVPIVFLSGMEDRESAEQAARLKPQGFLPKTLGKAALLSGIADFLS